MAGCGLTETDSDISNESFFLEPPKNRFQRRKSVAAERYNPSDDEDDSEKVCVVYIVYNLLRSPK